VKLENIVFEEKEKSASTKTTEVDNIEQQHFADPFARLLAMCTGSASISICSGNESPTSTPKAVARKGLKLIDFDFLEEYKPRSSQSKVRFQPMPELVLGTDGYIAPEAYLGLACPKSDVFSAGIVMFILMTGRYPHDAKIFDDGPDENFVGSPKMAQIHRRLEHWRVTFDQEWDPFPEAKNLCKQMLEFDVDKRPDASNALRHPWFVVDPVPHTTRVVPIAARGA
jgi:serine/threonine protein kinase